MRRRLYYSIIVLLVVFAIAVAAFLSSIYVSDPVPDNLLILEENVEEVSPGLYKVRENWFKKSESGLYEMYVQGDPFERGVANGMLAEKLVVNQEVYFIDQIKKIVPSNSYLNFLKYLVAWFNRHLPDYVNKEYQLEIFGVSRAASDDYDFIGPKYMRILNYHAAHDIGHALQDRNFTVGCTSFSAWSEHTADSTLIVGRNFDFYSGDDFAKDKIVNFVEPTKGYKLMFVTWGGFIGAVSGMNEKGLTVTINASKSDYPTSSATPISLVAREILQYASNIEEAYAIAKSRKTFVSESILIGSAVDNKSIIIEKSPSKIGLFESENNRIVCSNNYQSEPFKYDSLNIQNIRESSSQYRYDRMNELVDQHPLLDHEQTAEILRDRFGQKESVLGNGNEKAINQLIAHHSVIFKPHQRLAWVSTAPYQLGRYVCYDLNAVFSTYKNLSQDIEITVDSLNISADDFIYSEEYEKYERFRELRKKLNEKKFKLTASIEEEFIQSNPHYFLTYYTLGDYYFKNQDYRAAKTYYNIGLSKEIPTLQEREYAYSQMNLCEDNYSN